MATHPGSSATPVEDGVIDRYREKTILWGRKNREKSTHYQRHSLANRTTTTVPKVDTKLPPSATRHRDLQKQMHLINTARITHAELPSRGGKVGPVRLGNTPKDTTLHSNAAPFAKGRAFEGQSLYVLAEENSSIYSCQRTCDGSHRKPFMEFIHGDNRFPQIG
ncbi:aldose 1-epimerase [Anopheles sinensis]|uniref:Aldose 1-epimerase n=1 Tax=Anopheles sinensis TaxID=74873 RepID=A0A084WGZ3_ANOSI|nr:aldose 1-epimerase [Anopheles sinensis]